MSDRHAPHDVFHDVGSIFPGDFDVLTVGPTTSAASALRAMAPNRFSQVPVVDGGKVRGVFSLWSLSRYLISSGRVDLDQLEVADVMERVPSVTVNDPLDAVLEHLNRYDAVLVDSPHGVQAIATATDVLNYFYRVARPFVLLQEIELALRCLIEACVSPSQLQECIEHSLRKKYEPRPAPTRLQDMTFEDYRTLVTARENWSYFERALGRRAVVESRLEQVRSIRNDVFHFRDSVSVMEHETLAAARHWLFDKVTYLGSTEQGDGSA